MTVHTEARGPVWVVTLDRPEVRNAVDRPTADALAEAFRHFESNDDLLVAVLTGAAGHFCAGADLKAMASDPDRANRIETDGDGPMGPTRMELQKPTIAAIEGYAVAGGLELALWCDLRVAAETATLGFYDRRWGVPLIDGGTIRVTRLIGQSRAMDLLLTGRGVGAEEARSFGLVNRVVPEGSALDAAVELANEITRFPQAVMRADRWSAKTQWGKSMQDAIAQEFTDGITAAMTGETQRGAERFASGKGRHGAFDDI
ncbi:MAG: enoyl-CoA hydratase [Actinomycetota bacterium]|jgi:enoyl-CoA hydratase|nr:enoyl-CoA hydratase [Actinomycetota bacterium]